MYPKKLLGVEFFSYCLEIMLILLQVGTNKGLLTVVNGNVRAYRMTPQCSNQQRYFIEVKYHQTHRPNEV